MLDTMRPASSVRPCSVSHRGLSGSHSLSNKNRPAPAPVAPISNRQSAGLLHCRSVTIATAPAISSPTDCSDMVATTIRLRLRAGMVSET